MWRLKWLFRFDLPAIPLLAISILLMTLLPPYLVTNSSGVATVLLVPKSLQLRTRLLEKLATIKKIRYNKKKMLIIIVIINNVKEV